MYGLIKVYNAVCDALIYAPFYSSEEEVSDNERKACADLATLKKSIEKLFKEKGIDIDQEKPWYTEEWYREDLYDPLKEAGVPLTEENINAFIEKNRDIFTDLSDRNESLEMAAESFAEGLNYSR